MHSVLITRPQPAADEFAEMLRHEGYTAYVAPMMEYVSVAVDLADLAAYQALIFTSAQAVQIFAGLSAERNQAVLAVGDTTAATAIKAGFTNVHSAKGNSSDVAALVKTEHTKLGLKKILHLCSADTPDDIGLGVAGARVEIVHRPIYKAQLVDKIPDDVLAALQRGAIDIVMVFSTRTAENLVKLLQKALPNASAKLEAICISKAVAGVLRELPWRAIRVAHEPRMEAVMEALREQAPKSVQERRKKADRREKMAYLDRHGHVDSDAYAGTERRHKNRRAHEKRQRNRVLQEKVKFLNRSMLTFAFMFIAIVLAGVFLMAPEYSKISGKEGHYPKRYTRETPSNYSLGGMLNRLIEMIKGSSPNSVTETVGRIASSAAELVLTPGSGDFSQVLSNIAALRQQEGGDAAASQSIDRLRAMLAGPDVRRPEDVDRVVADARRQDPALDSMLGTVKGEDIGAAAMLLVLNEFRSDIDNNRPYADDLVLLKKLSGDDPRMNRALLKLAPYAESGVMNRQALQAELKGLAGDIVTAELQGKDISVQEAARKRLERLSRATQVDQVKGETPDAVVARAQIMLDKGDVKGAMRELEKLNGPPAAAARPWMNNATGYVVADTSSDDLTEGVLQTVSGASPTSVEDLVTKIKETLGGASVPYLSPALTPNGVNGGAGVVAPPPQAAPRL